MSPAKMSTEDARGREVKVSHQQRLCSLKQHCVYMYVFVFMYVCVCIYLPLCVWCLRDRRADSEISGS